ncbi:hypothetical protein ACVBEH_17885, partial [Roseateles sp. GG27B]
AYLLNGAANHQGRLAVQDHATWAFQVLEAKTKTTAQGLGIQAQARRLRQNGTNGDGTDSHMQLPPLRPTRNFLLT